MTREQRPSIPTHTRIIREQMIRRSTDVQSENRHNGTGTTKQMVDTITLTPGKYGIVGAPDYPRSG
ncbi:hypothetical protein [Casimicrobium huifangae]|uniref:hypothetical protein n=1 Tax=Casimicrobium huifangae TaxID=2591109 RepID=UPI003782DDD2